MPLPRGKDSGRVTGYSSAIRLWKSCRPSGSYRIVEPKCRTGILFRFAGLLLEIAAEDSGGFHLRSNSSSGKTTALNVAASVWGDARDYCLLWRATSNVTHHCELGH
jgi:hypothetical protein